jgi:3D (Asp-Asp-Asp) domain-containing protein
MLRVALLAVLTLLTALCARADRITAFSADEGDSIPFHGQNCLGFALGRAVEGCGQAAADLRVYPLGSILRIAGVGLLIVTDRGSGVRGQHVDVYVEDRRAVRLFARTHADYATVIVVRRGWNKPERQWQHKLAGQPESQKHRVGTVMVHLPDEELRVPREDFHRYSPGSIGRCSDSALPCHGGRLVDRQAEGLAGAHRRARPVAEGEGRRHAHLRGRVNGLDRRVLAPAAGVADRLHQLILVMEVAPELKAPGLDLEPGDGAGLARVDAKDDRQAALQV